MSLKKVFCSVLFMFISLGAGFSVDVARFHKSGHPNFTTDSAVYVTGTIYGNHFKGSLNLYWTKNELWALPKYALRVTVNDSEVVSIAATADSRNNATGRHVRTYSGSSYTIAGYLYKEFSYGGNNWHYQAGASRTFIKDENPPDGWFEVHGQRVAKDGTFFTNVQPVITYGAPDACGLRILHQNSDGSNKIYIYCRIDNVGTHYASGSKPVSTNGIYDFYIHAVDNLGTPSSRKFTVVYDSQPPVITGTTRTYSGNSYQQWSDSSVTVGFNLSDNDGAEHLVLSLVSNNCGAKIVGNSVVATSNGSFTVKFTDRAGNSVEGTYTVTEIDNTAPSYTYEKFSEKPTYNGYTTEQCISINFIDYKNSENEAGSGLNPASVKYTFDDPLAGTAVWNDCYSTSTSAAVLKLTRNGLVSVRFCDMVGNGPGFNGSVDYLQIEISSVDSIYPSIESHSEKGLVNGVYVEDTFSNERVRFSFDFSDEDSGVDFASIKYRLPDVVSYNQWRPYYTSGVDSCIIIDADNCSGGVIQLSVSDLLGNSNIYIFQITKFDISPPILTKIPFAQGFVDGFITPSEAGQWFKSSSVQVAFDSGLLADSAFASDLGSGVYPKIMFCWNNDGKWLEYSSPVSIPDSASSLFVKIRDNAGNYSEPLSYNFRNLDGEAPLIKSVSAVTGSSITNSKYGISLNLEDSGSGVDFDSIKFRKPGDSTWYKLVNSETGEINKVFDLYSHNVYIYVEDNVGNATPSEGAGPFTVINRMLDITAPEISIAADREQNVNSLTEIRIKALVEDKLTKVLEMLGGFVPSGVGQVFFCSQRVTELNDSPEVTWTGYTPGDWVTITENSIVTFKALDFAGNASYKSFEITHIDDVAPVISSIDIADFSTQLLDVKAFSAVETGSGLFNCVYRFLGADNSPIGEQKMLCIEGLSSFSIPIDSLQEGQFKVELKITDKSGNLSQAVLHDFIVDRTAPQLTSIPFSSAFRAAYIDCLADATSWFNKGSVAMELDTSLLTGNASDSGLAGLMNKIFIKYSEASSWQKYESPIDILDNNKVVYFAVCDNAGNFSAPLSYTFTKIDGIAPVVGSVNFGYEGEFENEGYSLVPVVSDDYSGVDEGFLFCQKKFSDTWIDLKADNGSNNLFSDYYLSVRFKTRDMAGNEKISDYFDLKCFFFDKKSPLIKLDHRGKFKGYDYSSAFNLHLEILDLPEKESMVADGYIPSGVKTVSIFKDYDGVSPYDSLDFVTYDYLPILIDRDMTIVVKAEDSAGNISYAEGDYYLIDALLPEVVKLEEQIIPDVSFSVSGLDVSEQGSGLKKVVVNLSWKGSLLEEKEFFSYDFIQSFDSYSLLSPCIFSLKDLPVGEYRVSATAFDKAGNGSALKSVSFVIEDGGNTVDSRFSAYNGGTDSAVDNGFNTVTGGFSESFVDVSIPGRGGFDFVFERIWSSDFAAVNGIAFVDGKNSLTENKISSRYKMGAGWVSNIPSLIFPDKGYNVKKDSTFLIYDGKAYAVDEIALENINIKESLKYYPWSDISINVCSEDVKIQIGNLYKGMISGEKYLSLAPRYKLVKVGEEICYFDEKGYLLRRTDLSGKNSINFFYEKDYLLRLVVDSTGRKYEFSHLGGNLSSIAYEGMIYSFDLSTKKSIKKESVIYDYVKVGDISALGSVRFSEDKNFKYEYSVLDYDFSFAPQSENFVSYKALLMSKSYKNFKSKSDFSSCTVLEFYNEGKFDFLFAGYIEKPRLKKFFNTLRGSNGKLYNTSETLCVYRDANSAGMDCLYSVDLIDSETTRTFKYKDFGMSFASFSLSSVTHEDRDGNSVAYNYSWTENGLRYRIEESRNSIPFAESENSVDAKKREVYVKNEAGKVVSHMYDGDLLQCIETSSGHGSYVGYVNFFYDNDLNLVREVRSQRQYNGTVSSVENTYVHDEFGNILEKRIDGVLVKIFKYDFSKTFCQIVYSPVTVDALLDGSDRSLVASYNQVAGYRAQYFLYNFDGSKYLEFGADVQKRYVYSESGYQIYSSVGKIDDGLFVDSLPVADSVEYSLIWSALENQLNVLSGSVSFNFPGNLTERMNEDGLLVSAERENGKGSVVYRSEGFAEEFFEYDDYQRLIAHSVISDDATSLGIVKIKSKTIQRYTSTKLYFYDLHNRLEKVFDPQYTGYRNCMSKWEYDDSKLSSIESRPGAVFFENIYDVSGRIIARYSLNEAKVRKNLIFKREYDAFGNVTKEYRSDIVFDSFEYDELGNCIRTIENANSSDNQRVTDFVYDGFSRKVLEISPEGVLNFKWNREKLVEKVWYPTLSDYSNNLSAELLLNVKYDKNGSIMRAENADCVELYYSEDLRDFYSIQPKNISELLLSKMNSFDTFSDGKFLFDITEGRVSDVQLLSGLVFDEDSAVLKSLDGENLVNLSVRNGRLSQYEFSDGSSVSSTFSVAGDSMETFIDLQSSSINIVSYRDYMGRIISLGNSQFGYSSDVLVSKQIALQNQSKLLKYKNVVRRFGTDTDSDFRVWDSFRSYGYDRFADLNLDGRIAGADVKDAALDLISGEGLDYSAELGDFQNIHRVTIDGLIYEFNYDNLARLSSISKLVDSEKKIVRSFEYLGSSDYVTRVLLYSDDEIILSTYDISYDREKKIIYSGKDQMSYKRLSSGETFMKTSASLDLEGCFEFDFVRYVFSSDVSATSDSFIFSYLGSDIYAQSTSYGSSPVSLGVFIYSSDGFVYSIKKNETIYSPVVDFDGTILAPSEGYSDFKFLNIHRWMRDSRILALYDGLF